MNEDSVFTKIIKGEVPATKIYEDELTIVILPLHFVAQGQILVIPKIQVEQFFELPEKDYKALMNTVKKMAIKMNTVLKTKRVGVKIEGLDVDHVHVKVLAYDNHEEYMQPDEPEVPNNTEKNDHLAELLKF